MSGRLRSHRSLVVGGAIVGALSLVTLGPVAPGRVNAASEGTIDRITQVAAATVDSYPLWISPDRISFMHQTTEVQPDRLIVDATIREMDLDGTDGWVGPETDPGNTAYDYDPTIDAYAYMVNRYETPTPNEMRVAVVPSGGAPTDILGPDPLLYGLPGFEAFSPDGSQILVMASSMRRLASDGSSHQDLHVGAAYSAWSPDGARIVQAEWGRVTMMDADGTDRVTLVEDGRLEGGQVTWSPDGLVIAVAGYTGLFFVDPDSRAATEMCDENTCWTVPASGPPLQLVTSESVSGPQWSPDGSRLAMVHSTNGETPGSEIAVVNADGSGFRDVTDVEGSATDPAWSPDGAKLAFASDMESAVPAGQGVEASASIYVLTLDPPYTIPGAPTGVTAIRGDGQAGVSWTAPADDGGAEITSYTVTASPGGASATVAGTVTTAVVTGLTNGTPYTFTVQATNVAGTGPASTPSNSVTPGAQLNQSITFTNPGNQTMLATPLTATATASSGLPVTLASNTTPVCTVAGFVITFVTPGSCSITASQAGNLTYKAANPVTRTFTISLATQTITFTSPGNKTLLQSPVSITATASSGLPVTLTSTTTGVCTVADSQITLLVAGSCSITASQAGDSRYKAATSITRTFTVAQVAQTITFLKPANQNLLQSPLTVAPTASSGLPVTLTSTTPAICSTSGFDVSLLSAGTCSLTASQPGNTVYKPATSVSRSFTITKAPQTITIVDPGPQSMQVPTLVLTAYASSGLPVTLASTTTGVCTIVGDVVTLKKAGTCKIKGTQAGDATYAAATAVTRSITVTASGSIPFVVATGVDLTVGGQPFLFHGASIYGTSQPGAPNPPAKTFALAHQAGLNSIRIVNMFDERGLDANAPFAATDWQRVDQILARARGARMRVVLDLSAFRNHLINLDIRAHGWQANCVGGGDRSPVDYAQIDPYRPDLADEWEDFLDFVVQRVNTVNGVRYRDDPTIAVISIAGEPSPPASEECGKATSTSGLTDFYERTLGYLASIDANHLRSNGGLIHIDWEDVYGGPSGIDGAAIFALSTNTLPSLHTYPPEYAEDGTPIDYATPDMSAVAAANDKPWFTEEFGWKISVGDATRADYYAWLYDEQSTYDSAGALLWNLGFEVDGESHDVNPATPLTWAEVQAR